MATEADPRSSTGRAAACRLEVRAVLLLFLLTSRVVAVIRKHFEGAYRAPGYSPRGVAVEAPRTNRGVPHLADTSPISGRVECVEMPDFGAVAPPDVRPRPEVA